MKPRSGFVSSRFAFAAFVAAVLFSIRTPAWSQSSTVTITLTGQSMIRSDLRATAPSVVPRIRSLLDGDVVFTNLEGAIAQPGQSVQEGRGFLAPPESLDALTALGFNLLSKPFGTKLELKGDRAEIYLAK